MHDQVDRKHRFSWTIIEKDAADDDTDSLKDEKHWPVKNCNRFPVTHSSELIPHFDVEVEESL